jgi:hypothetical protein
MELQENEKVLLRVRRHQIFFLGPVLGAGLAALVISLLLLLILNALGLLLALPVLLIAGGYIYLRWYQHRHDEWIITNQRIVDSLKKHWFHQNLSSADLVNVQDMSVEKNGIMPTLLNYGSLICQTAGATQRFVLKQIPNPNKVLDVIDQARDAARHQMSQPR